MQATQNVWRSKGLAVLATAFLAGCNGGGGGGGDDSPAVKNQAQTVSFGAAPTLWLHGTATVSATASSGLAVIYFTYSQSVCTVQSETGLVTALTAGDCIIAARQDGNDTYGGAEATQTVHVSVDPNQTVSFGTAPALSLFSTATVSATASSGLPVTYSSQTPSVCTVDGSTGLVTDLTATGACVIEAYQAGTASYPVYHAAQATQSITVSVPSSTTVPGKPTGVTATLGTAANTIKVSIGATDAGGAVITGYTVTSSPAGISGTGSASPITVSCPGSCNGYAIAVSATNAVGTGLSSDWVHVVTAYDVVETFHEPATQPNDSIFTGTFDFDSTAGTVANLKGNLTESMTGGCATIAGCPGSYGSVPMTLVPLNYQLNSTTFSSGLLVTTFALNTTNTFYGGTWTPQDGVDTGGVYYGFPSAKNPAKGGVGNAYAMIFVNTSDPTTALVQAQIDRLAYADCTAGGMMGAVCMTGTSVAGYGSVGTMGGYPISQVITKH